MTRDISTLRINPDSVSEALVEIRFSASEIADIIPAKLSMCPLSKDFVMERLPLADMPRPMREMNPTFAVSPILQQRSLDGSRIAKMGEQVFSWHALGTYPGWAMFQPEIEESVRYAQTNISGLQVNRIGLRYVNAFEGEKHGIAGGNDLAVEMTIAGERVRGEFNLNYYKDAPSMIALIKLATPKFVQGALGPFSLIMDIDVSTSDDFTCSDANQIMAWLENAHMFLKTQFFAVIPDSVLEKLAVA